MDDEPAFGVVDEPEVLAALVNCDDVHESSGELDISPDLSVDLDVPSHHDFLGLNGVEGVLQTVADDDGQGQALPELVGAGVGAEGVDAAGFGQHPVVGRRQGLEVLLGSASSHFAGLVLYCPCLKKGKNSRHIPVRFGVLGSPF